MTSSPSSASGSLSICCENAVAWVALQRSFHVRLNAMISFPTILNSSNTSRPREISEGPLPRFSSLWDSHLTAKVGSYSLYFAMIDDSKICRQTTLADPQNILRINNGVERLR